MLTLQASAYPAAAIGGAQKAPHLPPGTLIGSHRLLDLRVNRGGDLLCRGSDPLPLGDRFQHQAALELLGSSLGDFLLPLLHGAVGQLQITFDGYALLAEYIGPLGSEALGFRLQQTGGNLKRRALDGRRQDVALVFQECAALGFARHRFLDGRAQHVQRIVLGDGAGELIVERGELPGPHFLDPHPIPGRPLRGGAVGLLLGCRQGEVALIVHGHADNLVVKALRVAVAADDNAETGVIGLSTVGPRHTDVGNDLVAELRGAIQRWLPLRLALLELGQHALDLIGVRLRRLEGHADIAVRP